MKTLVMVIVVGMSDTQRIGHLIDDHHHYQEAAVCRKPKNGAKAMQKGKRSSTKFKQTCAKSSFKSNQTPCKEEAKL